MNEEKRANKRKIETTLDVRLMTKRTIRNLYEDFFGGKLPDRFNGKEVVTRVSLDGISVDYELYKKFSGLGASKEFLDNFKFEYEVRSKVISDSELKDEVLKLIPFNEPDNITSDLRSWTLNARNFDLIRNFKIEIETYSWDKKISEQKIKAVNKDNARRLRKYLVGLPSVQGVLFECRYREDDILEEKCKV